MELNASKAKYEDIFNYLIKNEYKGVKGVFCLDSGIPGPCMGVTILTHGNEPCGLEVAQAFIKNPKQLVKGKILICLNNISAGTCYFQSKTAEEEKSTRFVDINMNRLPMDTLNNQSYTFYEILRAKALYPIWQEFDYAIDIHSTEQPSMPMLIEGPTSSPNVTDTLDLELVIRGIVDKQLKRPVISFFNKRCISFGLEAGSHKTEDSAVTAKRITLQILNYYGMVELHKVPVLKSAKRIYNVIDKIIFPKDSFELVKIFKFFEPVKAGEVLAVDRESAETLLSPVDGVTLFAPNSIKPTFFDEEVMFICMQE